MKTRRKVTSISAQAKNPDRVNVSVDGKYRFSLDIYQVVELGVKVGREYSEEELAQIENESQFGKLYARALEYCLMRPHSAKEVRDYLRRKTFDKKVLLRSSPAHGKNVKNTTEGKERTIKTIPGVSEENAERTFNRLVKYGYVSDEKFARWWVENRNQKKGTSLRKLRAELRSKGIETGIIEMVLGESERNDSDELQKIIAKKRSRYDDEQKFMQYLARQGFSYDAIKSALQSDD